MKRREGRERKRIIPANGMSDPDNCNTPVELGEIRQDAMTSVHSMLQGACNRRCRWWFQFRSIGMIVGFAAALTGCDNRTVVNAPTMSPYPAGKMWAIAPLINESGTSAVDPLHLSDLLAQELQQVSRIDVLPVSRVLVGLRSMNIDRVHSVAEAQALVRLLDVDGLIVGTITAYDPYNPPVLGLTLQLYTSGREIANDDREAPLNSAKGVRILGATPSDSRLPGLRTFSQPVASVSAILDASDNAVRLDVERFARGRTDPDSILGWERFLYSMDAYTAYVGHRVIRDLIREERLRMGRQMVRFGSADIRRADDLSKNNSPPV